MKILPGSLLKNIHDGTSIEAKLTRKRFYIAVYAAVSTQFSVLKNIFNGFLRELGGAALLAAQRFRKSSGIYRIANIITVGTNVEVKPVAAPLISSALAQMSDERAEGINASMDVVGGSVGAINLMVEPHSAVPAFCKSPDPSPAFAFALDVHMGPKALDLLVCKLWEWYISSGHQMLSLLGHLKWMLVDWRLPASGPLYHRKEW